MPSAVLPAPAIPGPRTAQPADGPGAVDIKAARPRLAVAGGEQFGLLAALLGEPIAAPPPGAFTLIRRGAPAGWAFVPGHREPRAVAESPDARRAVPVRPPRRIELSRRADLLDAVEFVAAPPADDPATREILLDVVRQGAGLVYVTGATGVLTPAWLDVLAAAAGHGPVFLVLGTDDPRGRSLVPVNRDLLARGVPELTSAVWHTGTEPEPLREALTGWVADVAVRGATPVDHAVDGAAVTADDGRWREVLDAELRVRQVAAAERLSIDVATVHVRCVQEMTGDHARLPYALDRELHALSVRTSTGLDRDARETIARVVDEVVPGGPAAAVEARVGAAVRWLVDDDPDTDRTLLVTATAGVAAVTGGSASLWALPPADPPTGVLPPVGAALSTNCYLMWQQRCYDRREGQRWLQQALQAVEAQLQREVSGRYGALREALTTIAGEAVDHGVLLA